LDHSDWIDGYGIDVFLELMRTRVPSNKYDAFETEFTKFRRKQPPYNEGLTVMERGRSVLKIKQSSKWEKGKRYWERLHTKYRNNEPDVTLIADIALKYCRIPTGIEAVEQKNSLIKLIQRAERASMSPEMIAMLIYIVGNHHCLKHFNV